MSAQANHTTWTAYLSGSTGTVAAGTVLCLNSAGTRYVVSTAANRAEQSLGSVGVAITAGDDDNPSVELQFCGLIPASITGLGEGDAVAVKVSTTGTLERAPSPSGSDEVVGKCDEDGNALVNFATPSDLIAVSAVPGGDDGQVQYNNSGAFGGAANVFISGGSLAFGVGTYADAGDIRLKDYGDGVQGFTAMKRTTGDDGNVGLLQTYYSSEGNGEAFVFGANAFADDLNDEAFDEGYIFVRRFFNFAIVDPAGNVDFDYPAWTFSLQSDPYASGGFAGKDVGSLVVDHANFTIGGVNEHPGGGQYGGGRGVMLFGAWESAPSAAHAPSNSLRLGVRPTSFSFEVTKPDGTIYPLWDGPEKTFSTTGTSGDVSTLDANGVPIRTLYLNGAGDQNITSLTDGREGRSIAVVVATSGGDSNTVTLTHNSGGTSTNRIMCPGGVDLLLENDGSVELVYSTTSSRWHVKLPKTLPEGALVGTTDTQTLTDKTLENPKMSDPYVSGQLAGDPNANSPFRFLTATITFASANYTLAALEYSAPILILGGTTGGARDLIAPNMEGALFLVRNTTADTITVKKSGGTGVAIATNKSRWVIHTGTDYAYAEVP